MLTFERGLLCHLCVVFIILNKTFIYLLFYFLLLTKSALAIGIGDGVDQSVLLFDSDVYKVQQLINSRPMSALEIIKKWYKNKDVLSIKQQMKMYRWYVEVQLELTAYLDAAVLSKEAIGMAKDQGYEDESVAILTGQRSYAIYDQNNEEVIKESNRLAFRGLEIAKRVESIESELLAHLNIASNLVVTDMGEDVVVHLSKADKILRNYPDGDKKKRYLSNMNYIYSSFFYYLKQDEDAKKKLERSVELLIEVNNKESLLTRYGMLAMIHEVLGEIEQAKLINQNILKLSTEPHQVKNRIYAYQSLSSIACIEGDAIKEKQYLDDAEYIITQEYDPRFIEKRDVSEFYTLLAEYHAERGGGDVVLDYIEKSYSFQGLDRDTSLILSNIHLNELKAKAYAGKSDYKVAYESHLHFLKLKEARRSKISSEKIAELEVMYDVERQEYENNLLLNERNIQSLELKDVKKRKREQLVKSSFLVAALVVFSIMLARQLVLQRKLKFAAEKDALTGLDNRSTIANKGSAVFFDAKFTQKSCSVLLLDIDNFKGINDNYGHDVGDKVLQKLAEISKEVIRDSDHFGRWGGEEFVAIFEGSSKSTVRRISERLRCAYQDYDWSELGLNKVTASIGVFSCENIAPYSDFQTLVDHADSAMYQAKKTGKNKVVFNVCNLMCD